MAFGFNNGTVSFLTKAETSPPQHVGQEHRYRQGLGKIANKAALLYGIGIEHSRDGMTRMLNFKLDLVHGTNGLYVN